MKVEFALSGAVQSASAGQLLEFRTIADAPGFREILDARVWADGEHRQGDAGDGQAAATTKMFMETDLFGHAVADALSNVTAQDNMHMEVEAGADVSVRVEVLPSQDEALRNAGQIQQSASDDLASTMQIAPKARFSSVSSGNEVPSWPSSNPLTRLTSASTKVDRLAARGLSKCLEERLGMVTQLGPVNATALRDEAGISVFLRVGGAISGAALDLMAEMARFEVSGRRLPIARLAINAVENHPEQET